MIELENYCLANIIVITVTDKDHQWMLKVGSLMRNRNLTIPLYKILTKRKEKIINFTLEL